MKTAPSYTKILTIGSGMSENALVGDVIIQEKVDGSLFCFGWNEDGELTVRSKGKIMDIDGPEKMFQKAVDYARHLNEVGLKPNGALNDMYFYCEFLEKPKHNVLCYEKVPRNNLVLFDCLDHGRWLLKEELANWANQLDIDVIPELFRGIATVDTIKELLTTQSYLGKEIIEGVVIKNYHQALLLGGQVFPLFTKFVREEFKEKHSLEWKGAGRNKKAGIQEYILSFRAEPRWQKAVIHLKEKGLLTNSPKDIGPLMQLVKDDIVVEEKENIKEFLYKIYEDEILRVAGGGLPMWYKNKLLESLADE